MATNDEIPAADTEMAECDGEEVVTMMDVLKEQQDFEDDANAVLGGSDDKECTYSRGYIKRQAIYACMTCCPESKDDPSKRAGFCLACSLTCHENHDLVELYTKRNFRCDCGNPKFKTPCQFTPNKLDLNDDNVYNQNFIGLYCICSKPYGDQESTLDDEMIQCVVCEDWWHATHLDAVLPAPDQYGEMICKLCMLKNEFLHDYSDLAVNEAVDVVKVNGDNGIEAAEKLANGSLTDEKLANGSLTDEKPANDSLTDEKLANDSLTDEKLANDLVADEKLTDVATTEDKLTNGIIEAIDGNDMETDVTDVTKEDISRSNEDNSTEKESIEPEKIENVVVDPENLVESKSDAAPTDIEESDKAAEVLSEICSEDKLETTNKKTEGSDPSEEKVDSAVSEDITEQSSATSIVNKEEPSVTSENKTGDGDKTEDDSAASATDASGEKAAESVTKNVEESELSKENNESSSEVNSETEKGLEVSEKPTENVDPYENKVTEDQEAEINAEKEEVDKNLTADAETDKPSAETNENSTDNGKASETAQQDEEMKDISQETEDKIVSEGSPAKDTSNIDEARNGSKESDSTNKIEPESNENKVPELENKRKMSTEDDEPHDISVKKPKLDDGKCLRPKGIKKVYNGATFWPATFRQKLCTCNECISMYKDLSVLFLTDMEDTVFAYETLGKERTAGKPNQYEKGMEALCSLGRIQQIDALTEYNKMRDKLLSFLQSFKDKKEVVTEHDIKTFFAGMKPEKRTDGVYFCG